MQRGVGKMSLSNARIRRRAQHAVWSGVIGLHQTRAWRRQATNGGRQGLAV